MTNASSPMAQNPTISIGDPVRTFGEDEAAEDEALVRILMS
jgi:hypothetical protein